MAQFSLLLGLVLMAFCSLALAAVIERMESKILHGNHFTMDGRTWRYHQIYAGVWRGIDPNEWDDTVHIANHKELDYSDYPYQSLQSRSLESRDLRTTCKAAVACVGTAARFAQESISENWDAIMRSVYFITTAQFIKKIWDFLNQPFIATVVGPASSNVGMITGWKGLNVARASLDTAKTESAEDDASNAAGGAAAGSSAPSRGMLEAEKTDPPAQCSNLNSEFDVIYCLGQEAFRTFGPEAKNAMSVTLTTPQGNTWSLAVTMSADQQQPPTEKCGAPSPVGAVAKPRGGK